MIRFLIIRVIIPLLLIFLARALFRSLFGGAGAQRSRAASGQRSTVPASGELKKDPVCGTYVSAATSLTRTINGRVLHFCSAECRDKYRVA